jgi:hypothetical protein
VRASSRPVERIGCTRVCGSAGQMGEAEEVTLLAADPEPEPSPGLLPPPSSSSSSSSSSPAHGGTAAASADDAGTRSPSPRPLQRRYRAGVGFQESDPKRGRGFFNRAEDQLSEWQRAFPPGGTTEGIEHGEAFAVPEAQRSTTLETAKLPAAVVSVVGGELAHSRRVSRQSLLDAIREKRRVIEAELAKRQKQVEQLKRNAQLKVCTLCE